MQDWEVGCRIGKLDAGLLSEMQDWGVGCRIGE